MKPVYIKCKRCGVIRHSEVLVCPVCTNKGKGRFNKYDRPKRKEKNFDGGIVLGV